MHEAIVELSENATTARSAPRSRRVATGVAALALVVATACGGGAAQGAGDPPAPTGGTGGTGATTSTDANWPLKTREHVDLWMHGFAMVQRDTTRIPYFRRGYRDMMVVEKNRRGITTQLDQNRERLAARFALNRNLVSAQFLVFSFNNWEEMSRAIAIFIRAEGDPGRASDRQQQAIIAFLAGSFNSPADRDWLQLFAQSLNDEQGRFYHDYWLGQQRSRANVITAVDTLWQRVYRPRLQTYLTRTQQESGDLILSLPLDGEGRTVAAGKRTNQVAVTFPDRPDLAVEAIYVAAHEMIGAVANTAIADNVTPTERREGLADRYAASALVRGGAMLLQKNSPNLVDGYARYYLRSAGLTPAGDVMTQLAREFPLPEAVLTAMARQLESVQGGI